MGEVYHARDTLLDRDVAVKLLPASVANDARRLRRLEQEARAAAHINHPNVVVVYDVASINGATAIVSELLEGETLGQRLARGRIPAAKAVRYAVHIAEGLAAAHGCGVVHRDLKPDNIFITTDGDRAKILDFGLAKPFEPLLSDAPTVPHMTMPGTMLGTVGYMSPEQIRGETDQRSDIFSFGVVLFEMLSGQRAFQRASAADTVAAILNDEPPELTGESPALLAIVNRCLAKNPDARYQSARDLAFHLEQLSSFTGPVPAAVRQPSRTWQYLGGAVLAALLVAGFVWQLLSRRSPPAAAGRTSSIAVVPFANVGGAADAEYFSDGMTEELINALSRIEGLRVAARTSSFAFKEKRGDAREIAKQLGVGHLLEGSVRQSGNRLRVTAQLIDGSNGYNVWSETYDRELLDILLIQEEISREIAARLVSRELPQPRAQRASADEFAAYDLYLKANFLSTRALETASQAMLEQAISQYGQAIARNPRFAAAYSGLANAHTHFELVSSKNPQEHHRQAAAAARKALELDPNLAEAHVALGDVLFHHEHDVAGGEREFRRAIELDPNLVQARIFYGYLLVQEYRLDEALVQLRLAARLSPFEATAPYYLAEALIYSRKYEEAVTVLEAALRLDAQFPGLGNLAVAHSMLGEHEKAVDEWTRAVATAPPHPFTRMVTAWVFARAGRREEATKILNEVLNYAPEERIKASHSFGGTYIALGDNERALEWLQKGVDAGVVSWFEVKASPWFDALRSDPRFTALIERALTKKKHRG